ncbi:putative RING finger protein nhl-1-like [Apostichopus japonicus]|uniref:Putative RING finger protein nhl-1-like n=1 Tax=Stichopus japonicus TaxID=307972 RepID=A0A2G8KVH7_STIJA|nr:putative RING finger protein nhl-1-like [Apostichopus japonicus]
MNDTDNALSGPRPGPKCEISLKRIGGMLAALVGIVTQISSLHRYYEKLLDPNDRLLNEIDLLHHRIKARDIRHELLKNCDRIQSMDEMTVDVNMPPSDLQAAIQAESDVMRKISELEKYKKLSWWHFVKRLELTQSIEVLKQSLDEARKLVEREAETCGQRKIRNLRKAKKGSSAITDEGHKCSESIRHGTQFRFAKPPTCTEISGINQPHDVLTFQNEIFVLMDDGIKAYNMEGTEVKVYQKEGFRPFAAVFLDKRLYVTDKSCGCVAMFDQSLNYIDSFGESHMTSPAGISSCPESSCIYVLTGREQSSAAVAMFERDGTYIRQFRHKDLHDPWYIKRNHNSSELLISDFARNAIEIYSPNLTERNTVIKLDVPGRSDVQCRGIDVDGEGNIYVALRAKGYVDQYEIIVKYNPHKKQMYILEESPVGGFFSRSKRLNFVRGLHFYRSAGEAFLMIVDPGNNRVMIKPV